MDFKVIGVILAIVFVLAFIFMLSTGLNLTGFASLSQENDDKGKVCNSVVYFEEVPIDKEISVTETECSTEENVCAQKKPWDYYNAWNGPSAIVDASCGPIETCKEVTKTKTVTEFVKTEKTREECI